MNIQTLAKKAVAGLQALVLAVGLSAAAITGVAVSAAPAFAAGPCDPTGGIQSGADCAAPTGSSNNLFADGGIFETVANVLIFLVGAIAVIYLIVGGLRYVTSSGDPKAVGAAKDTILYAIVGIVVAVISYALVSFVISSLSRAQGA